MAKPLTREQERLIYYEQKIVLEKNRIEHEREVTKKNKNQGSVNSLYIVIEQEHFSPIVQDSGTEISIKTNHKSKEENLECACVLI